MDEVERYGSDGQLTVGPARSQLGVISGQPDNGPAVAAGVVELDPRRDTRWGTFVESHPAARAFHHPGWLDSLEQAYGCRMRCLAHEDAQGHIDGVLPLAESDGLLSGRRLLSLPHTPVAGSLSAGPRVEQDLLQAAAGIAQRTGRRLEVRLPAAPREPQPDALLAASDPIYVRELPDDPVQLRFGNSRNHGRIRWAVSHAERSGVEIRHSESERDLRCWYSLYLRAMRTHAHPPIPYRFFEALARALWPLGVMVLSLAERRSPGGRELLAGSIFLRYGRTVIYAFNGRREDAFALRPNDLLQWQAIHDAVADGYRIYDFGEVPAGQQGLAGFKLKWGGTATTPVRYLREPDGSAGAEHGSTRRRPVWLESAWRRLPLAATEHLGRLLYRYG